MLLEKVYKQLNIYLFTMEINLNDIFLLNKHTPRRYWTEEDETEYNALRDEMKNSIEAFRQKNLQFKHYESHKSWFDVEEKKVAKPYLEKMSAILNRPNFAEKNEVVEVVEQFQKKYDFNDVRVMLIVKEFLRNYVINCRLQKEIAASELLDHIDTENGTITRAFPLLRPKKDYTEMYMKTIVELDRITKEDKVVETFVNGNAKVLTNLLKQQTTAATIIIDVPSESTEKRL